MTILSVMHKKPRRHQPLSFGTAATRRNNRTTTTTTQNNTPIGIARNNNNDLVYHRSVGKEDSRSPLLCTYDNKISAASIQQDETGASSSSCLVTPKNKEDHRVMVPHANLSTMVDVHFPTSGQASSTDVAPVLPPSSSCWQSLLEEAQMLLQQTVHEQQRSSSGNDKDPTTTTTRMGLQTNQKTTAMTAAPRHRVPLRRVLSTKNGNNNNNNNNNGEDDFNKKTHKAAAEQNEQHNTHNLLQQTTNNTTNSTTTTTTNTLKSIVEHEETKQHEGQYCAGRHSPTSVVVVADEQEDRDGALKPSSSNPDLSCDTNVNNVEDHNADVLPLPTITANAEIQSLKTAIKAMEDTRQQLIDDKNAAMNQREKTLGNLRKKRAELAQALAEKEQLAQELLKSTTENSRLLAKNASLSAGIQKLTHARDNLKTQLRFKMDMNKDLVKDKGDMYRSMKDMQATRELQTKVLEAYRTLSRRTGFANMGKEIRELEKQLANVTDEHA